MSGKAYQLIVSLTSTCPQAEVKDDPASDVWSVC